MNMTLKAARVNKGYTQRQAAKRLNVTEYTICNWERNKTYPNVLQMKAIEKLYDISFDQLIFLAN